MIKFLKFNFNVLVFFLIVISLFPGSLIGLFLYGDLGQQPNLVKNPYGTTLNHFIAYFFVSLFGFSLYLKNENFKKLVYKLFFLSIILEILQFIIPIRSFQLPDLIANMSGVLVALCFIKIYLFFNR